MDSFDLESFLEKYKLPLILSLLGLIFIGVGLLVVERFPSEESKMEVISPQGNLLKPLVLSESRQKIVTEIAGAVLKPGVYELTTENRVNDLLILGGGLSSQADRDWVAKNINLAQKLNDGVKVYIPNQNEKRQEGEVKEIGLTEKININTASLDQLDTLWGVGEVTARQIIEGRPYGSIEDLANKGVVKSSVWMKIKDKISTY